MQSVCFHAEKKGSMELLTLVSLEQWTKTDVVPNLIYLIN